MLIIALVYVVAQASDPVTTVNSLLPIGGGLAAFVAVGYLLSRIVRQETRLRQDSEIRYDYEIAVLRRENRVCNEVQRLLIYELIQHQIFVREDIMSEPERRIPPIPVPKELQDDG